jgi:hypothetical protein
MDTVPLTGAEVREWRLGWGLQIRELAPRLSYTPGGITQIELGHRRVPAFIAEHVRAHPAPPEDPTYPPTPEGLAAAMAAQGRGTYAWAHWWGGIGPMGVWHWLKGHAPLPVAVAAWLRAGAPRTGRLAPPPRPVTSKRARRAGAGRRPRAHAAARDRTGSGSPGRRAGPLQPDSAGRVKPTGNSGGVRPVRSVWIAPS